MNDDQPTPPEPTPPDQPDQPGYADPSTLYGYGPAYSSAQYPAPQYPAPDYPAPQYSAPTAAPKPTGMRRNVVTAALVAAVVGGAVGATTAAIVDHNDSKTVSSGITVTNQTAANSPALNGTVTAAANKIIPSVVTLSVSGPSESGTGSGVILRTDGYVLTNNHVVAVAGSGGSIQVLTADGRTAPASIVGTDPSDDLAVVKINLAGLTAATFGKSSSLVVGQTVVAVGAPLGLSNTVTSGIVSNIARPVQTGDSTSSAVFNAIQTDAPINPGNSGGPLVDLNGAVVGIDAAIASAGSGGVTVPGQSTQSGSIGIGFAIPSDEASRIAGELIATGKATHAVIGVNVGATSANSAVTGATISSVTANSPAQQAGLAVGDVVTKVNSQLMTESVDLVAAIRSYAPGSKVTLTYTRGGTTHTTEVTLGTAAS
jgi:putative serine protease PepD